MKSVQCGEEWDGAVLWQNRECELYSHRSLSGHHQQAQGHDHARDEGLEQSQFASCQSRPDHILHGLQKESILLVHEARAGGHQKVRDIFFFFWTSFQKLISKFKYKCR